MIIIKNQLNYFYLKFYFSISFVHSSDNSIELLVLATFHQVFLLSVKRRSAAVGQLKLHGSSLSPPLIDWRERVQVFTKQFFN